MPIKYVVVDYRFEVNCVCHRFSNSETCPQMWAEHHFASICRVRIELIIPSLGPHGLSRLYSLLANHGY